MKNGKTTQSLFFVFCLFCFLLLSNNTLDVMFYTYICYWNTFQYKCTIQIIFSCRKTISCASDFKRYLFTLLLFLRLFLFCLDIALFQEALLILQCWTDTRSSVLVFWGSRIATSPLFTHWNDRKNIVVEFVSFYVWYSKNFCS